MPLRLRHGMRYKVFVRSQICLELLGDGIRQRRGHEQTRHDVTVAQRHTGKDMHRLAALAKSTAEQYVKTHCAVAVPDSLPPDLRRQQACYVYIFANPGRRLRARFGSPLPRYRTLAEEIISHTATAMAHLGMSAIQRAELKSLVYLVAVLGPLQRISHTSQLDPQRFGLCTRSDQGKLAVILPQRTGIETVADQLATALRESSVDVRRETYVMYRFAVTYYE